MAESKATTPKADRGTRPDIKADDSDIGKLDYATIEDRLDVERMQIYRARSIVCCIIELLENEPPADHQREARVAFALEAVRDLLETAGGNLEAEHILSAEGAQP